MRTCGITLRGFAVFLGLLVCPAPAAAEWQIKPFLGLTLGGGTTFLDFEKAAGTANVVYGVSGLLLGDFLGIEGDFGRAPGFFQRDLDEPLVLSSSATTLTGNVVFALPRRMAEYSLRPYVVAGAGLMHVAIENKLGVLPVSRTLGAMDLGGGVTGFLNERLGLSWEVRHFRSISGRQIRGVSVANEKLSFWRANMSVVIRY